MAGAHASSLATGFSMSAAESLRQLDADVDQLRIFLSAMFRYADEGTYISFRGFDQKDRGRPPIVLRAHPVPSSGDFSGLAVVAAKAADTTCEMGGVFAPPVATFLEASRARHQDTANGVAISVELDEAPAAGRTALESILGPATLVMASGSVWIDPETGEIQPKLHMHWRLSEPTAAPEDHNRLRTARWLAAKLAGGDMTAPPPCHPLRWPGSWNIKRAPKLAQIVALNEGIETHLSDALERLQAAFDAQGLSMPTEATKREPRDLQAPVERIISALAMIPNNDEKWDEWVRVGMAIWAATSGADEGLQAWEDWSSKSSKYTSGACFERWNHFSDHPPHTVGAHTIFGKAKDHGWGRFKMFASNDDAPTGEKSSSFPGQDSHEFGTGDTGADKPRILVRAGELDTLATKGEAALCSSSLPIYQRGDVLVRPISKEVSASRGRTTVAAGLTELSTHAILDLLSQSALWVRFDKRAKAEVPCDPPGAVPAIILSRKGQWKLPPVAGVITTPTLRPDGSILSEPGYDSETRLFHVADNDLRLKRMPETATRADALEALDALKALLAGFPFVSEVDRAVALSGLITPVVRGALSVVPLHGFRANTAGSGKSYLVDIASAIATGRPCPVVAAGQTDEETEKRLVGLLIAGFPIVSVDNVNGELGGDLLCQLIERPLIRVRPLGRSEIMELESRATVFGTGNGLRVRGDMTRRSLVSSLDAQMERPELRKFSTDPMKEVLADRGKYVSACLTIVRAYAAAGRPARLPSLASFEDWSDSVRSALVWLGCEDPVISMEAARDDDPDLVELREVLGLWKSHLGFGSGYSFTARDVAEAACKREASQMGEPTEFACPEFRDVLLRIAGDRGNVNTRKLGTWLMDHAGRIVGGLRVVKGGTANGGVVRWNVEVVK